MQPTRKSEAVIGRRLGSRDNVAVNRENISAQGAFDVKRLLRVESSFGVTGERSEIDGADREIQTG